MRRIKDLVAKAKRDFELARKHKQIKEYATATILYASAIKNVLKALFISRTRKEPPKNASVQYLANHAGVPTEISVYMTSMEQERTMAEGPADFYDVDEMAQGQRRSTEVEAFYMEGLVKRLLDHMYAYTKI